MEMLNDDVTYRAFPMGDKLPGDPNKTLRLLFGFPFSSSKDWRILDVARLETPIGDMIACASEKGICLLEFSDLRIPEPELSDLLQRRKGAVVGESKFMELLKRQLADYFSGRRTQFDVPLHMQGTEFRQSVWNALQRIPYGTTCSYKEQAASIGRPRAVRAVANANGMNRIAILVPCHRVIGADGKLTGYAGGMWRKKYLLDLEHKQGVDV